MKTLRAGVLAELASARQAIEAALFDADVGPCALQTV